MRTDEGVDTFLSYLSMVKRMLTATERGLIDKSLLKKKNSFKKINAKLHDGVCQHCKGILEWRVKFSKYKLLSKPKKCVKCLQKAVKDPYHIICRPCACKLGICAKCGKEEEIVIPIDKGQDRTESKATENVQERSGLEDELDFEANFSSTDNDEDSDVLEERFKSMNFERTEG
uniref:Chromosome 9 open reading frame 85 n=1 Tax=Apteryx owenii TaxID=8824 RepID=A0A8B9NSZ8_APTOW